MQLDTQIFVGLLFGAGAVSTAGAAFVARSGRGPLPLRRVEHRLVPGPAPARD